MAEYRTDLSRSIAGGKLDSPTGALKKAGLVGANPAAVEPMFNGSAIMEALGYNNPNGKIDIGIAGGSPGNRPQPIAGGSLASTQPIAQQPTVKTQSIAAVPTIAGGATSSPATSQDRFVASPGAASLVSTPKAIAGMTPDNLQTVGKMMDTGLSANGVRRMDAVNQKAIAGIGTSGNGLLDDKGRTYEEQVAHAQQVNEAGQRDLMRMSPREQAAAETVNNRKFGSFIRGGAAGELAGYESRRNAIAGKLADTQAQRIAGIKEQGDKYTADQTLAGVKYNADANVKAAGITGDVNIVKAQQLAQAKQQEQGQKDYTERIKSLVGDWSKLNLPKEYVPKLNEFAKIYAAAEDPTSNTWLMPPNREGGMYAAMPRQYESVYTKLIQTMPHKDAAARIYQLAQQNGHVKDVPDFRRFLPTSDAIKNQNQTLIAGA